MFRVKICGITSAADAVAAAEAGADAIGLNFYAGSPRCCSLEIAREIAAAVPRGVCRVGVFVDAPAAEIRHTAEAVGLDAIQLHGNETAELQRAIRPLPIVRAFRVAGELSAIADYLMTSRLARCEPRMLLLDAYQAGVLGGTGKTLDWSAIAAGRHHLQGIPLVLAGGLTSDNVAQAIAAARPWAVDTASGVEIAPGKKSADKVRAFVAAAHQAFARAARAR
jgi:phosphoribosylanthranilate isomerase